MLSAKFYQVGGAVRDRLLNRASKDIDFAVEAESFDAMRDAIHDKGGEIFLETPKFLTIRAKVPPMGACDYVLCRKDGDYSDGRHPDTVEVGTIYDDLSRRDFTMNAIAIADDEHGTFIDPYNGTQDIADQVIRSVGDPVKRFTEDGLRMLRAMRFCITLGFRIDIDIMRCLLNSDFINARMKGVSAERIREELVKMFAHSTLKTLELLNFYSEMRDYIFSLDSGKLWLKPTMEAR